ncbi:deoxycytidyl transferase [Linderina pennispora]|nr:deoxycytidyl transferase [Linderina pennispora]
MSAWRAEMKDYVAQLRTKYKKGMGADKVGRSQRIIMHVDFDCFFVTASLLSHPYLKGKPVVVCHSKQLQPSDSNQIDADSLQGMGHPGSTSQIASCNYVARSFGVRNGMFLGPARERCPGLMTVPYYFDTYKRISRKFYEELTQIADETQAASIDEALLDVTEVVYRDFDGKPERLAQHIRQIILEQTQCTATLAELQAICGKKTGQTLYNHSRGIDDRVLESDKLRQVFEADVGWGVRFSSQQEADQFIGQLSAVVCEMMSAAKRTGRAVTLKVKRRREGEGKPHKFLGHGICDSLSKSTGLSSMTNDPAKISAVCVDLLQQLKIDPLDIRSVGIQVSKLNSMDVAGDIGDLLTKPAADTSKPSGAIPVMELPSASQLDSSVFNELPESIRQELQAVYQQIDPSISIVQGKDVAKDEGSTHAVPVLFNASSLDDVLDLVRQWVDAYSHGPLDEDVDEFSNYATSLVKFHDLSASERMLKHLKYWASSKGKGKGWQHAVDTIISDVNRVCVEMYESHIFV